MPDLPDLQLNDEIARLNIELELERKEAGRWRTVAHALADHIRELGRGATQAASVAAELVQQTTNAPDRPAPTRTRARR